jgi:hypothetical protein
MNIPELATVLTAVIQHDFRLCDEGATSKDYLVPKAWGDPCLGKSDVAETVIVQRQSRWMAYCLDCR